MLMVGHLGCGYGLNGWGSYDKVSCFFIWKNAHKKIAGLQGSTLSGHHMTTGFCPFELPTCELLQRQTTPHLRLVLFEESSSCLAFKVL